MKARIFLVTGIILIAVGLSGGIYGRLLKNKIGDEFRTIYPKPHSSLGSSVDRDELTTQFIEEENRHREMQRRIEQSDRSFEWVFRYGAILGGAVMVFGLTSKLNKGGKVEAASS